ncbi:Aminomethyltransferase, mitochondrial [Tritrichomonas foetus]|uniref:Aminomethyltransferase n=1 Tax=Tritrichomonas foetus TaxID=1144522 RepID=A0A1J4KE21_9EUKA|nr:Aminomethyltransferase, mitochondrial [Tritrichomonas foetus]|eukprot:OHT09443.1 Aminomethyltransferase, mitochondrial [Tritrichomonas foetus]
MLSSSFCRHDHTASLLKTALTDFHIANGGEMVDYAGYAMPVKFEGLVPEHLACRKECTLYDTGHMGQYLITGPDKKAFIERVMPVSLPEKPDNLAHLSVITNEKGGIIDDCMVASREDDVLYLVVNAGCRPKDDKHLRQQLDIFKSEGGKADLTWLEGRSLLALQGPKAINVMNDVISKYSQTMKTFSLSKLPFMTTTNFEVDGISIWASRSGYTGEDGFEIGIDKPEDAVKIADLLARYKEVHLGGLGSRDSLRLESGLCLYGHEMNEETTPVEASLGWLVDKKRMDGSFVGGNKIVSELKDRKLAKKHRRVGLKMMGKAPPPRSECKVFDKEGKNEIGHITSGSHSPLLNIGIAMAYVPSSYASVKKHKQVKIQIRNRMYPATVCKLPFVPTHFYRGEKSNKFEK